MSKATHKSSLIRHLHLVAIEPCSAIVLSETEYELIIVALGEYKAFHTSDFAPVSLSDEGVAIIDSLRVHLRDHYSELPKK